MRLMTDQSAPSTSAENQVLLRLLGEMMNKRSSGGALPALALATSVLALGVAGFTAIAVFNGHSFSAAPGETATVATVTGTGQLVASPGAALAASPLDSASGTATAPLPGNNVRIAQSGNGMIYAFDPNTLMAFSFTTDGGATAIPLESLPADVRDTLVNGTGQSSPIVSGAALDAQTDAARAALAASAAYEVRPPLNEILSNPEIATEIVKSLDMAQGVVRPGAEGGDPVIYTFFDPQCPYCKAAFAALDGQHTIKWLPLSTLGPAGDRLHAYFMGEVTMSTQPVEGGEPTQAATFSEDTGRADRFASVMREEARPLEATLTEAQSFVLAENGELFRLLSRGAEDMRAVPTFFIRKPDGTAVWLRGFSDNTEAEIAAIVAGGDAP